MNRVILVGNLANDPEPHITPSGVSQCTFRLAVSRRFANQQGVRETDFFTIICWRQTAEFCGKFLSKGRKVAVEGSIQTRSYNAQDGSKRYVTEIIADSVESLGSREDGTWRDTVAPTVSTPAPAGKPQAPASTSTTDINDYELPF